MHRLGSSPAVAGFIQSGRLATLIWCNEAEPGSLSLRLARWPPKASPAGFLRRTLGWLPVVRAINMVNTFQLTRSARLSLALQISLINTEEKEEICDLLCNLWLKINSKSNH